MPMKYSHDEHKTAWKGKTHKQAKSWGEEIWIGSLHQIHAKVLFLHAGKSTSLKYYPNKNEVLFVRNGSAEIAYASEEYHLCPEKGLKMTALNSGDVFFVQSGCPYRITALTNCEIFEIGDNRQSLTIKLDDEESE